MAHLNRKAHRISFIVFVQPLLQWHTKQLSRVTSINVDGITNILYNRLREIQGFISFMYNFQTYIQGEFRSEYCRNSIIFETMLHLLFTTAKTNNPKSKM